MIDIDDVTIELTDEDIKFIDSDSTMLSMTEATQKDLEGSIALAFEMINKNKENSGNDDIRIGCSYGSSIKGIDDFINYKEYLRRKNNMKTSLEYKLIIKGRNAEVGSELWLDNGDGKLKEVTISKISICDYDDLEFIDKRLFWEKSIAYQLPDTEGNLSEVKVGQPVWLKSKYGKLTECVINEFNGNNIEIMFNCNNRIVLVSNKEGLTNSGGIVTINKPSRFHGKQDWSQAPEKAVAWAIDEAGHAYWYLEIPNISNNGGYWTDNSFAISAGYRNDLIDDRKNMEVTDWRDSLVMRPKGM